MARAFARIAFTPQVRAAQSRMGSRDAYALMEQGEPEMPRVGLDEAAFIAERDSFYMATVGADGWPYIQHRGGPPGFLNLIEERTLAFADFAGNRQYISLGNLAGNDRVSLFLMDYAQRQRLKIWGRARVVEADDSADAALLARVALPGYPGRIERAIAIRIEALDWNCSKHITPRYTQRQIRALMGGDAV
jgi:hypothetical protein